MRPPGDPRGPSLCHSSKSVVCRRFQVWVARDLRYSPGKSRLLSVRNRAMGTPRPDTYTSQPTVPLAVDGASPPGSPDVPSSPGDFPSRSTQSTGGHPSPSTLPVHFYWGMDQCHPTSYPCAWHSQMEGPTPPLKTPYRSKPSHRQGRPPLVESTAPFQPGLVNPSSRVRARGPPCLHPSQVPSPPPSPSTRWRLTPVWEGCASSSARAPHLLETPHEGIREGAVQLSGRGPSSRRKRGTHRATQIARGIRRAGLPLPGIGPNIAGPSCPPLQLRVLQPFM